MSFSMSSVKAIDEKFSSRRMRPDHQLLGRPVNPFAKTSSQTRSSTFFEEMLKPEISATTKLGAEYRGHVVDTKFEPSIKLDEYAVATNPLAGHKLHTTRRIVVEHTREK